MKITISGNRREGKTTIASLIARYLEMHGMDVTYKGHNPQMNRHFRDISRKPLSSLDRRDILIEDRFDGEIEVVMKGNKENKNE